MLFIQDVLGQGESYCSGVTDRCSSSRMYWDKVRVTVAESPTDALHPACTGTCSGVTGGMGVEGVIVDCM